MSGPDKTSGMPLNMDVWTTYSTCIHAAAAARKKSAGGSFDRWRWWSKIPSKQSV